MNREIKAVLTFVVILILYSQFPKEMVFGQEQMSSSPAATISVTPTPLSTHTAQQSSTPTPRVSSDSTRSPTSVPQSAIILTPTPAPRVLRHSNSLSPGGKKESPTRTIYSFLTPTPTPKPIVAKIGSPKPPDNRQSFIIFPFLLMKSYMDPKDIYASQALSSNVTLKLLLVGLGFIITGIIALRWREGDALAADIKRLGMTLRG